VTVKSILRRKGAHVETAPAETTIGDAARRLCEKGVGSLLIVDRAGKLLGVLAERDVVRAVADHGISALELPVGLALCGPPATCTPHDSLERVMSVMTARRTRHLPVIAEHTLVGIVSIGDIVKTQLEVLQLEVGVLRDYVRMYR
jgi:CBS domain-containing protein